MFILTNAWKSLTRSLGRNFLLFLIVACVAAAASVALAIKSSASKAEESGLANLTISATIGLDRQRLLEQVAAQTDAEGTDVSGGARPNFQGAFAAYPELTLDELQVYAGEETVRDFRYSGSISVDATGEVEAVSTQSTAADDGSDASSDEEGAQFPNGSVVSGGRGGFGGGPMSFGGVSMGDLQVTGYGSESAMTGFIAGSQRIVEGAMIDLTGADDECLISDEFATYNSLSLGDSITVANPAAEEETYVLTVVGVYHDDSASQTDGGGMIFSTSQDPANRVIASYPTVQAISSASQAVATTTTDQMGQEISTGLSLTTSSTYVFASPGDYEAFTTAIRAAGLDEAYSATSTDVESYQESLVPLNNLISFANTLLLIVLAVGGVVLVAIAMLTIRERKYEVGVLTAIGVSKPKVALQLVVEMFLISVLGLVVGLGLGAVASVPVADRLLSAQVAAQTAQEQSVDVNFGRPAGGAAVPPGGPSQTGGGFGDLLGRDAVEYIDQINATLDWTVVLQMAGVGLGLALVASLVSIVFVMRYEPLTILANRS
ncbi:MAG: FtsX-like permease family protein [Propionibacteriaceae bacterium]|jgi:putative ABC transport system permease protein|nr:FtsX-like permease family protein [Propionibacteriaceae bacterium]